MSRAGALNRIAGAWSHIPQQRDGGVRPSNRAIGRAVARPALTLLAVWLAAASSAVAQPAPEDGLELRMAPVLEAPPGGQASRALPTILQARELTGRPDLDAVAEGDVEFRRGNVVIRADRLSYDQKDDIARALGHVRVSQAGSLFSGPELQLRVERFEGFFQSPAYHFSQTGAGGTASRIDFLDEHRAVATDATYSSCTIDGPGDPAWVLSTKSLLLDSQTNEGIAHDAVLRFYGVPILAAPVLSFPLTEERKSGWLPPSLVIDSRSGVQVAVPYYWNIAPN